MMKTLIAASALAASFGIATAQAMPVAALGDTGLQVIPVFGGCGPYGHRGPYGGCQPGGQWGNGSIRPFYTAWGAPRCPPGYRLGPYRQACWPRG